MDSDRTGFLPQERFKAMLKKLGFRFDQLVFTKLLRKYV